MGAGPSDCPVPADPWPLPISVDLTGFPPAQRAGCAEGAFRARPGVAVFVSGGEVDEAVVSVSACGDLRAFVGTRLQPDGPRLDLSSIVSRIDACECGSGFEADLAHESLTGLFMPEALATAAAQRAVWFLHLDPSSRTPACRVIAGDSSMTNLSLSTVLGPFSRRSHAEAYATMLETRFELCREPATLAMYPDATACAYKDMGACPAPCDGSEPIEAYTARASAAIRFDGAALGGRRSALRQAMESAVSSMDFEGAGRLKAELAVLEAAFKPGAEWVRAMDRFAVLGIMPAGKAGWARVFVHRSGVTMALGDVRARTGEPGETVLGLLRGWARPEWPCGIRAEGLDLRRADGVALVWSHLRSNRKTRGRFFPLEPVPESADLSKAVRRAAGVDTDEVEIDR